MRHGTNPHLPDKEGVTLLQLAVRTRDVGILQISLNHHRLVPTREGEDFAGSVLLTAIDEGASSIVEFLLREGYVDADYQNKQGETPMHRALLKQRADLTAVLHAFDQQDRALLLSTTQGESCLHYAARYSNPKELRRLLYFYRYRRTTAEPGEEKAERVTSLLNRRNAAGRTTLLLAATCQTSSVAGRWEKMRVMLNAGAKLLGGSPLVTVSPSALASFSDEVHACLSTCLQQCVENDMEGVKRFCVEYLEIIWKKSRARLVTVSVLVSALHPVDAVPLLLSLPFRLTTQPLLLAHVKTHGAQRSHPLLMLLHKELTSGALQARSSRYM
jgi:hypothetical protein